MGSTRHTQQHEPPRTAMSLYIDSASHLHHDQEKNLVVTCPHCQAVAHITPSAVPRFEDLQLYRPNQVGLVYLCDACHAPIFLRFTVRSEEHTSELQSRSDLVCRLLLEKKNKQRIAWPELELIDLAAVD